MDIMDAIHSRRTIHAFKHDPIPDDTLSAILEAATWAPSHKNEQPWRFARVGAETRAKLLGMLQMKVKELLADEDVAPPVRKNYESLANDFGGAPVMIAVYAQGGEDPLHTQENQLATACAVQNLTLAAWAKGVGAVWLTVGSVPPAKPVLQAGDGETVVALLALGYPDQQPPALPRTPWSGKIRDLP